MRALLLITLCAVLLSAPTSCGPGGDPVVNALSRPCPYFGLSALLSNEYLGFACPWPPGTHVVDLPCRIDFFTARDAHNRRLERDLEFDPETGDLVAEGVRHFRGWNSGAEAYRYRYLERGADLLIERADWTCEEPPDFEHAARVMLRYDDNRRVEEIRQGSQVTKVRYVSAGWFPKRVRVDFDTGEDWRSYTLNAGGDIVMREVPGALRTYPTTTEYRRNWRGNVQSVKRLRVDGRVYTRATLTYRGERLARVDAEFPGGSGPDRRTYVFSYDCTERPRCAPASEWRAHDSAPDESAEVEPQSLAPRRPDPVAPHAEALAWGEGLAHFIDRSRKERDRPLLGWDNYLSGLAARQALGRSLGVTLFDMREIELRGYEHPVRAEKLGTQVDAPAEAEYDYFDGLPIWDRLQGRAVGLGVARMTAAQPEAGRLVLVVIAARRPP